MRPVLVLWDVDNTLVHQGGAGPEFFQLVLAEMYDIGLPVPMSSLAGRTDTSIALELLAAAGLDAPAELPRFHERLATRAPELADMIAERGSVLPGVRAALAAVAGAGADGTVVQTLLTGNLPALARVKLDVLDLREHLDLEVGAYGDASPVRADLVPIARRNAAARYGADFGGPATVIIGDTPHDVTAATATGARGVGVATGAFSVQQLADTGADVVLPDLTDTDRVLAAILGSAVSAPAGRLGVPAVQLAPQADQPAARRGRASRQGRRRQSPAAPATAPSASRQPVQDR